MFCCLKRGMHRAEYRSWIESLVFPSHKLFLLRRTEFAVQKKKKKKDFSRGGKQTPGQERKMMVDLGIVGFSSKNINLCINHMVTKTLTLPFAISLGETKKKLGVVSFSSVDWRFRCKMIFI